MPVITAAPSPSVITEPEPITPPRPDAVRTAQNQLLRAGHSLPKYGADGQLGSETRTALLRFQQKHALPLTGALDDRTLRALETASSPSPDYAALFADGVLHATLALGHDESGAHRPEQERVVSGLATRGYVPLTDEQKRAHGYATADHVLSRTQGEHSIVLELITPDAPDARDRFARALQRSELIMYGGHGRYGSGPDFDDIHSPRGNFVLGAPYAAGHVTLGPNDLDRTRLPEHYQLLFFDGCSTFRYFDDLRARTPGKSTKTLDVIGSNTELFWSATAANLLTTLDQVSARADLGTLTDALDAVNRDSTLDERHFFRGDGFDDN